MAEYFDPKTNKFPYPEDTDKHYLVVHKDNGLVFDENYHYIEKSKWFKFKQFWVYLVIFLIVFPVQYLRMGLKIEGKENLKKHKEEISKGVLSVCNHVHMWDYLGIMNAIKPKKPYILAWARNIQGEMSGMMRMVGAIPIPENDLKATAKYMKDVGNMLDEGGWLHIYPEGSMWEYYAPIRPFKRGVAYFSIRFNKPIIPFAYSYRKPSWIRRHIFGQIACFTLRIGEPIYNNPSIEGRVEQEKDLAIRCHDEVCRLAGINPQDNLYKPLFDNDKRIDYYTKKYGVGYKGSH